MISGLQRDLAGSQSPAQGRRKAIIMSAVLSILLFSGWIDGALAEVTVYPTTLYLNKMNRHGRFTVSNSGTDAKVIDVSLSFGYPVSDTDGNISFRFLDSTNHAEPWMDSWVSIYPGHFELAPGEFQVVAVAAKPPEDLPDGEYWLRPELTVRSVDSGTSTDAIPERLASMKTELHRYVLGVNYRQGVVRTGISIRDISTTVRNKRLRVLVDVQREGNAAYRGNILCSLRDAHGNRLADLKRTVAVYHSMKYRFEIGDPEISDGSYTARVELNTDRSGDILQSPPVQRSVKVTIRNGAVFDNESNAPENTRGAEYPRTVRATQDRNRSDALVESHLKGRVLEKRLKEINREQDMILKELHELTVIIQ